MARFQAQYERLPERTRVGWQLADLTAERAYQQGYAERQAEVVQEVWDKQGRGEPVSAAERHIRALDKPPVFTEGAYALLGGATLRQGAQGLGRRLARLFGGPSSTAASAAARAEGAAAARFVPGGLTGSAASSLARVAEIEAERLFAATRGPRGLVLTRAEAGVGGAGSALGGGTRAGARLALGGGAVRAGGARVIESRAAGDLLTLTGRGSAAFGTTRGAGSVAASGVPRAALGAAAEAPPLARLVATAEASAAERASVALRPGGAIRVEAIPSGSRLEYLAPGRVRFDGVEFRAVRDLGHLSEAELREMAAKGNAFKDVRDVPIHGHHYQQLSHRHPEGFIVEIPRDRHAYANKVQHPKPKGEGLPLGARIEWERALRKDYYKERARTELLRRGLF